MIYLILPLNRNKANSNSVSKLWYKYFDINTNNCNNDKLKVHLILLNVLNVHNDNDQKVY